MHRFYTFSPNKTFIQAHFEQNSCLLNKADKGQKKRDSTTRQKILKELHNENEQPIDTTCQEQQSTLHISLIKQQIDTLCLTY